MRGVGETGEYRRRQFHLVLGITSGEAVSMRSNYWRTGAALCVLLTGLAATAQEVAPPAADETLIYVLRAGRFAGGGAKVWIAVNDQTVARLENKGYAVVRAKAGRITLNLASIGFVLAATAIDDRPGQTVYIQWRVGELGFTELDATAGRKAMQEFDQTPPIEETLPNNEQVDALMNFSRLGFDVDEVVTDRPSPDSERAVLTIFRRKEAEQLNFGVWYEDRYLGTLFANQGLDVVLPPGEHYFMSGYVGSTLMKATVEAGKHYYAWFDVGGIVLRVKMMPIAQNEAKQRDEWLKGVTGYVRVDESAMTPRVREREAIVTDWIHSVVERAKAGTVDYTEITPAHGF